MRIKPVQSIALLASILFVLLAGCTTHKVDMSPLGADFTALGKDLTPPITNALFGKDVARLGTDLPILGSQLIALDKSPSNQWKFDTNLAVFGANLETVGGLLATLGNHLSNPQINPQLSTPASNWTNVQVSLLLSNTFVSNAYVALENELTNNAPGHFKSSLDSVVNDLTTDSPAAKGAMGKQIRGLKRGSTNLATDLKTLSDHLIPGE